MQTLGRTRQGLRRLKNLDPRTAFHDVFSYTEQRFPRVVLDQRNADTSRALRRGFLKEREMKKFKKIGVCRTKFHGIQNLADCEFLSSHDLLPAARAASALAIDQAVNLDAFFEQLSERLRKDADLIPINDLVAIMEEFYKNNYLDLGLVNKVKNEIVYDIDRMDFPELAVALYIILGGWNIVSPRLINATLKRAVEMEPDVQSICVIIKSLKKSPNGVLWKSNSKISHLVDAFVDGASSLTFSDLSSTIHALQYLGKRGVKLPGLDSAIAVMLAKPVTDIESAAEALSLCSSEHNITPLLEAVGKYVPALTETIAIENAAGNIANLVMRNRAVNLAASLIHHSLRLGKPISALAETITEESVRGLKPRALVEILDALPDSPTRNIVISEIRRKKFSLGGNLRGKVEKFL